MTVKHLHHRNEARLKMLRGVEILGRAVAVTFGPRGRNVLIEKKWGTPSVSKDGVTVAKAIDLADPLENVGACMVREAARQTSESVGDGTTAATALARSIFSGGLQRVVAGMDPMALKRGIDKGVDAAVAALRDIARPIGRKSEIHQVGAVAANNDDAIGSLIAEAMDNVGKEGVVMVEDAKRVETTVEVVDGMRFDQGYLSPYFVSDAEPREVRLEEPFILIHEKKIHRLNALESVSATGEESEGLRILARALTEPLRQIARNAGFDGSLVLAKVREGEGDFGFNAETLEYENLFAAGVVDPAKVVRLALQNAASVAGLMLTTEVVVTTPPAKGGTAGRAAAGKV